MIKEMKLERMINTLRAEKRSDDFIIFYLIGYFGETMLKWEIK
jgi:hypothetical protein